MTIPPDGIPADCPICGNMPRVGREEDREFPWFVWCLCCQVEAGGDERPPYDAVCGSLQSDAINAWNFQVVAGVIGKLIPCLGYDQKTWDACAGMVKAFVDRHEELAKQGPGEDPFKKFVAVLGEKVHELEMKVDVLLSDLDNRRPG